MNVPNNAIQAGDLAHFGLHHLAQRPAVAAGGDEQNHEILDRAGKHHADQDPEHARQITHLGRQNRPDQRSSAGDRRKVMAKQDVAVGRNVIEAVVQTQGGRGPVGVESGDPSREVEAVVAIGDQIGRHRGDDDPHRIDGLAPVQRDRAERERSGERQQRVDGMVLATLTSCPSSPFGRAQRGQARRPPVAVFPTISAFVRLRNRAIKRPLQWSGGRVDAESFAFTAARCRRVSPPPLRQETFFAESLRFWPSLPANPVGSYDFTWIWKELGLDDERR